jgi:integrase
MKESSMSAQFRLVRPRNENRSVPVRPANAELRQREYLTPKEVEKLIKTARDGRYGHRDATLILVAFRHGLRASEICDLEWSQVEFGRSASLHVRRVKNGKPSVHPLRGDEIRALRELRREFPDSVGPSSPAQAVGLSIWQLRSGCKTGETLRHLWLSVRSWVGASAASDSDPNGSRTTKLVS